MYASVQLHLAIHLSVEPLQPNNFQLKLNFIKSCQVITHLRGAFVHIIMVRDVREYSLQISIKGYCYDLWVFLNYSKVFLVAPNY